MSSRRSRIRRTVVSIGLVSGFYAVAPVQTGAQSPTSQPVKKPLTLEALYGPKRVDFDGEYATGMRWAADGQSYFIRQSGLWNRVDVQTGAEMPAYDADQLAAGFRKLGLDEKASQVAARNPMFDRQRAQGFWQLKGRLAVAHLKTVEPKFLDVDPGVRQEVDFSPRGQHLSYVRGNDLYVLDLRTGQERPLTRDGHAERLNGILDWVYEEEVYGRGSRRGYWWRDDDAYIAYLTLDERRVPFFTLTTSQHPQSVERWHFPKPGDPNPGAALAVVSIPEGRERRVDLSRYEDQEILIVRVAWSPQGTLFFQVQNREQTWLDLNEADPRTGDVRHLFRETTPAWVSVNNDGPTWIGQTREFLWLSERDGWRHIYRIGPDGATLGRLTEGEWEVRELLGVDAASERAYFTGVPSGGIATQAFRVRLTGGAVEKLTDEQYSHRVSFDPTFSRFFDTFSNITTPPKVYLRSADGAMLRAISENAHIPALAEYEFGQVEITTLPARDGAPLHAILVRPPPGVTPAPRPAWPTSQPTTRPARVAPVSEAPSAGGAAYPLVCSVYAGPQVANVTNRWGGLLEAHLLATRGYLVMFVDPRTSNGYGAAGAWKAHRCLGVQELADIEDAVRALIDRGEVDPERVGILGHSYGGYMTCYALTHSKMFAAGVAMAPVTDWRLYDTIYTERYMGLPADNEAGYDASSAIHAAGNLHGRLLVLHGAIDDNVHAQHTLRLAEALQKANIDFDLMIYPTDRHGLGNTRLHVARKRLQHLLKWL